MKAIERILWLAYGNHTQTSEHRELAEIIINRLRKSQQVEKTELMEHIGLDPGLESDNRKFQRIMQPLKGQKSSNPLDLRFVSGFRHGNDRYYSLDRSAFDTSFQNLKRNIRYAIDTEPGQKILELQEKVQDQRKKIEELQNQLDGDVRG